MIDYTPPPILKPPTKVVEFANKNGCSYVFFDNIRSPYKGYSVYDTTCNNHPKLIVFILENQNEIKFADGDDFNYLFMFDGNPFLLCE